jgi:hypothetical protein
MADVHVAEQIRILFRRDRVHQLHLQLFHLLHLGVETRLQVPLLLFESDPLFVRFLLLFRQLLSNLLQQTSQRPIATPRSTEPTSSSCCVCESCSRARSASCSADILHLSCSVATERACNRSACSFSNASLAATW